MKRHRIGRKLVTPFMFDDHMADEGKQVIADQMEKLLKAVGAQRYGFVSEAWATSIQATDNEKLDLEHLRGIRPSQQPNRIEVVHIMVQDHTGSLLKSYEMVRAQEEPERVVGLRPLLEGEGGGPGLQASGGRFANLLK